MSTNMTAEGRSNRLKIPTCHGVCPKHHVKGMLVLRSIDGRLYWYCHHWWQKGTISCYVGKVGRGSKYFNLLTMRKPDFIVRGERIQKIAKQLDGLDNKQKIMVAMELYVFEELEK